MSENVKIPNSDALNVQMALCNDIFQITGPLEQQAECINAWKVFTDDS